MTTECCAAWEKSLLSQEPSQESFNNVSQSYKVDKELLEAEFAIFKAFRAESADKQNFSKASEVYEALHKAQLSECCLFFQI